MELIDKRKSLLTKLIGHRAMLIHGDTAVMDRWQWIKARLPLTRNGEKVLDIGCGTGAFAIGASLRGYQSLGLSWDERNQSVATYRATMCKAYSAKFDVLDVRYLDKRSDLIDRFDIAICCENIEHIIDDRKLMIDIARCLKPGGRLLLTAPFLLSKPVTVNDRGPFSNIEDGGHVRRGYSKAMLEELCAHSGMIPETISYCSGFSSQKVIAIHRVLTTVNPLFAWLTVLPLRILPFLFDRTISAVARYPYLSICLEAYKPRYC